jgi:hypothetical protein
MLLAKINPPAITVRQNSPFEEPTQVLGDLMRVIAERYELGSNKVRFQVSFGFIEQPNQESIMMNKPNFKVIHFDSVILEGEDIETWGEDDTVIMELIASKFNTQVVEYQNIEVND